MRWLLRCLLIELVPEDYNRPMASKPSGAAVALCAILAALSMAVAVYFGGTGRTPLALAGTLLFVILGGLAFELARRRSV
jgi:hypothetical protein